MTVVTKPGRLNKKARVVRVSIQEPMSVMAKRNDRLSRDITPIMTRMFLVGISTMLVILLTCATLALLNRASVTTRRYKGYCRVPMAVEYAVVESQYIVSPFVNPDMQVVSTLPEPDDDDFANTLREELDIGDSVEKIAVINNGRRVDFIHDFSDNTTGIVDEERCFVMDLQPDMVLGPEAFVTGLAQGEQFDVSRVRSGLSAALPALRAVASVSRVASACGDRPVYRLYRQDHLLEKRSAGEPHDYIQFAGKHVQEIKIYNLQEVLDHELQNKA